MQILYTTLLLLLSSGYVILLDHFGFSSRGLQKSLVFPILVILFIIYRTSISSWKVFLSQQGKWFVLLWGTILVQTFVIATGGLQSPFLVLIHLLMIALSFLFSFSAAVIFLFMSFLVIFIDISFSTDVVMYLTSNLSTIILQLVSLLSIIPLAYIISQQYHLKDVLSTTLRKKVTIDEAIIESLDELIIVTDAKMQILSVNDAVAHALQKPRSALLNESLFGVLLLKDSKGALVKIENLFPHGDTKRTPIEITDELSIMNAAFSQKKVTLQIQKITTGDKDTKQFCIILSPANEMTNATAIISQTVQKARAKYEGLNESLKQSLSATAPSLFSQLLLIEKIETDLYMTNILSQTPFKLMDTKMDLVTLCKQLTIKQQGLAESFQTTLRFTLSHFSHADIAPLTVKNFPVKPEQLTGPFFTTTCNSKGIELVLKKIIEIAIFLASTTTQGFVNLQIKLKEKKYIVISITASCPQLNKDEMQDLFMPNYNRLAKKTNLHAGSGLEGYLVKSISEQMNTPVEITYNSNKKSEITFTLVLKRHFEEVSKPAL